MLPTYTLRRIDRATLDWTSIPTLTLTHCPWLTPAPVGAYAQACHDGENIYVRMQADEVNIRAELTHELDMICEDSCLEFFLAPDAADVRYLNFEWNLNGALYLGFGARGETRVRQIVQDREALFMPRPFRTATGWGVEYRIPASFIAMYFPGFELSGESHANFYKCGDKTVQPHYLAWNIPQTVVPKFHTREAFGRVVFE